MSLPFVNYGGVLGPAMSALFEHASDIAAERRLNHRTTPLHQHFADAKTKWHKVTMLMPLGSDQETTWTLLDRKVRNEVRKAEERLTFETGGRGRSMPSTQSSPGTCRISERRSTRSACSGSARRPAGSSASSWCMQRRRASGHSVGVITAAPLKCHGPLRSSTRDVPNNLRDRGAINAIPRSQHVRFQQVHS